ncbi:GtrA family protein [Shuttleworthella satelles]|uniref:GtrA-like protein n=1 Tax=Shuttleworthella satelles DSM 14600 TaxID=626523 RepID=C4GCL2_9FIRM|nr:GtrA family protein [Shuttleworthia satelles]EEP27712.1 GtrA-like protein [Shuttleworthia satelles DSM 14600]
MEEVQQAIFDRAVRRLTSYRCLRWFAPVYENHRQFWLYALFGLGTILLSINLYLLLTEKMGMPVVLANSISWIFATAFAFLTNRRWVFVNHKCGMGAFFHQMLSFFTGRFFTLILEDWLLYFLVDGLGLSNTLMKYLAQLLIIASNYFISKLLVFRRRRALRELIREKAGKG